MSTSRVEIKTMEDGPNIVFVDGRMFGAICRCGVSENKPYCDGTHEKIGFRASPAGPLVIRLEEPRTE